MVAFTVQVIQAIDFIFITARYPVVINIRCKFYRVMAKLLETSATLPGQRSEKSKLGLSAELATSEIEQLYPTISVPVTLALFDLGSPDLPSEDVDGGGDGRKYPVSSGFCPFTGIYCKGTLR